MFFDHQFNYFAFARTSLSVAVLPIQYLVEGPIEVADWLHSSFESNQTLLEENANLHAQQLLLRAQVQKLISLEKENIQLRELLSGTPSTSGKMLVAEIFGVNSDPSEQQVLLDKGSKHGAYIGQPVLGANGIMGQVTDVGPYTSRALLLIDRQSALPVQDIRNNVRAIAVGNGAAGTMSLIHLPLTADIQVGDKFVTSGFGQRFPYGYPVGVVSDVVHTQGNRFLEVTLSPNSQLLQSRLVLLLDTSVRGE